MYIQEIFADFIKDKIDKFVFNIDDLMVIKLVQLGVQYSDFR